MADSAKDKSKGSGFEFEIMGNLKRIQNSHKANLVG